LNFSFPLIAFVSEFLLTIIIINYSTKEKPDGSKNIIKHKHFLSKLNHHAETPKISQLKGQINQNSDNSALAIFKNASLFFLSALTQKEIIIKQTWTKIFLPESLKGVIKPDV